MAMEKQNEKERVRKAYGQRGTRTQKLMSFRIDFDNWEWLEKKNNKGRYINDLIAADRQQKQ